MLASISTRIHTWILDPVQETDNLLNLIQIKNNVEILTRFLLNQSTIVRAIVTMRRLYPLKFNKVCILLYIAKEQIISDS